VHRLIISQSFNLVPLSKPTAVPAVIPPFAIRQHNKHNYHTQLKKLSSKISIAPSDKKLTVAVPAVNI
jgi:hypothetical protein